MTQPRLEDTLALKATTPEHCLDCFRPIRPGATCHEGAGNTVLCPSCFSALMKGEDSKISKAANDLAFDIGNGLLRVRREGAAIAIKSQQVRHLVDALVQGAARERQRGRFAWEPAVKQSTPQPAAGWLGRAVGR